MEEKWKTTFMIEHQTPFPFICSLIGRVLYTFRQKMDQPNPPEMDVKVIMAAPTIIYMQIYGHSLIGKK